MKYQDASQGLKSELKGFLSGVVNDLLAGRLVVEGQTVEVPDDSELDFKVKYSEDEEGGSVTIKVSWDNVVEEIL